MGPVSAYWRPASLEEALSLVARPGAVVIGGGTALNADPSLGPVEAVDLQALGLGEVERPGGELVRVGAMVRLQQLVDSDDVPAAVREAARRELPSTLRAQATLGGSVVGGDWESELLASLLVHDAVVSIAGPEGVDELPLEGLLADRPFRAGRILTAVTIDVGGVAAVARTGRTPADRAIVAAAARRTADGARRLALSGVAATPVLVEGAAGLDPPGDFRGSSEYRRALASVLAARALEAIA